MCLALLTHSKAASISFSWICLMLAIIAHEAADYSQNSSGLVGVLSYLTEVSVSSWCSPREKQLFSLSGPMSFSVCPLSIVWSNVDISLLLSWNSTSAFLPLDNISKSKIHKFRSDFQLTFVWLIKLRIQEWTALCIFFLYLVWFFKNLL